VGGCGACVGVLGGWWDAWYLSWNGENCREKL
jgi:hypothetical protein